MPEPLYLMDHHKLRADIHYKKGMICVDCHDQNDVMGTGDLTAWQQEAFGTFPSRRAGASFAFSLRDLLGLVSKWYPDLVG